MPKLTYFMHDWLILVKQFRLHKKTLLMKSSRPHIFPKKKNKINDPLFTHSKHRSQCLYTLIALLQKDQNSRKRS